MMKMSQFLGFLMIMIIRVINRRRILLKILIFDFLKKYIKKKFKF